tara:strand:+ start:734 stop:1117 length:384 start_codon:yes stop_codon:yes gene_type:complete
MTKDNDNANWKWGWSPEIDADDERGYFQTKTELVAAFLYEVIKPKLSDDAWDTLIKAIHNERVSSPAGIQSPGRVLANMLVRVTAFDHLFYTFEKEERSKEERAAKERLLEELNDRAAKYYSATKFF